ncbi:MAG: hypothetical protein KDB03_25530 [Planctomycetales bacterium]|nr:hypothetical protein [Planctomycetales bacterium]
MAIKFKCSCGKDISVPDAFAGKNGKCPKCQQPVKVPGGASTPSKPPSTPKSKPAPTSVGAPRLDSLLDDVGLKKQTGPICPKCATPIKAGAKVCVSCGLNFETGEQIKGFNANVERPEFDNPYLQEAALNMRRELLSEERRDKASMPWWMIMSFLIGAVTLCAAGVVIVDGQFGEKADPATFTGKIQNLPVYGVLGATVFITGSAIAIFAHLSIVGFMFGKSAMKGIGCFIGLWLASLPIGIANWADCKAAVKAIGIAMALIGFGHYLIVKGGGWNVFNPIFN